MAEALAVVGIAANFAGVIGAGLALSRSLYDFAHILGSASEDIKSLATDVSLFCAVLKQVQSTLAHSKAYRLSLSALSTAQDVIDRCKIIFDDLSKAVTKLQGGKSKPDFMVRVKWYFKEKRVLLVHEQLKTCGATLHLMLTTLVLAQKIANRRLSSVDEDDQDDQDRLMTHSLFTAQQAATERLATIENQLLAEDGPEGLPKAPSPAETLRSEKSQPFQRRNRPSEAFNGGAEDRTIPRGASVRPVSRVIGGHLDRLSLIRDNRYSHLAVTNDRRYSILQTDELLRQWTDQSDPLAADESQLGQKSETTDEPDRNSYVSLVQSADDDELSIEGETRQEQEEAAFWVPQSTPDGRLFYFNTLTGISTMELPLEVPPSTADSGSAGNGEAKGGLDEAEFWVPQATPDGRLFYFNTLTERTTMELPLEVPPTINLDGTPLPSLMSKALKPLKHTSILPPPSHPPSLTLPLPLPPTSGSRSTTNFSRPSHSASRSGSSVTDLPSTSDRNSPGLRARQAATKGSTLTTGLPPPVFVRAIYDYEADDRTSLSFRKGDFIQVLTQLDSGWWDGVINNVRGWFPSNYTAYVTNNDDDSDDLDVDETTSGSEDDFEAEKGSYKD